MLKRFSISLEENLLEIFDNHIRARSYTNRSEAIRDLIRNMLVQREWEEAKGELAGTLSLVYDHHHSGLTQKLLELQHDEHGVILSTLHVHLDHHNCLEVLVLKGPADKIKALGQKLISTKGVKHGQLGLTTTGQDLL